MYVNEPDPPLDQELAAKIALYLATHGRDSLLSALDAGHLFDTAMRAGSKLAIRHSGDYVSAGLPCTVVFQLNPKAARAGERTEVSVTSGAVQLTLDFPTQR